MNITNILFKVKDTFGGSKIRSHFTQIKNHFEADEDDSKQALDNLIQHAIKHVPYYRDQNLEDLTDFPVVNKAIIKSNFKLFQADNHPVKGLTKATTSGSTGTPFTVYQDKNKKSRNYGDTLYFGNRGGFFLGNKLVYLKIWIKEKMHAPWQYGIQKISTVNVTTLTEQKIQELLADFKNESHEVHTVLAYVSALEQIIRYCEKNNITDLGCKFSGVITMAEGLSPETRKKLEILFKCKVVARYSNLENGILAQQEIDKDYFLVNTASYLIEIFHPEKDEPVSDGTLGRIVLTDLYNYAMPLIRYDTGDLAVKGSRNGKTYLETVEGRKLDAVYNTSGEIVSSYIVAVIMWRYMEVTQFQLVQTGEKSYEFKINCPEGFTRNEELINDFKTYFGQHADFKLAFVDGIPLLNSGKHRKTVNLWKKQ